MQPDRITLHIPSDAGVVITVVVVGGVRLRVVVLPREAEREAERRARVPRILVRRVVAERLLVVSAPDDVPGSVLDRARGVQLHPPLAPAHLHWLLPRFEYESPGRNRGNNRQIRVDNQR